MPTTTTHSFAITVLARKAEELRAHAAKEDAVAEDASRTSARRRAARENADFARSDATELDMAVTALRVSMREEWGVRYQLANGNMWVEGPWGARDLAERKAALYPERKAVLVRRMIVDPTMTSWEPVE